MNTDDMTILLCVVIITLQILVVVLLVILLNFVQKWFQALDLQIIDVVTRVSARQSTARMPTGMPREGEQRTDLPPSVQEATLVGGARRSKRRVAGGDPESEQHQHLQRGLPKRLVEDGVE